MLRLYNTLCTQSYNPIIMLRLYCMTDASQNVHRAMESWHVQCEWMGLQGLLVIHRNRAMHKVIIIIIVFVITIINYRRSALFFSVSLAVLDPRVGHTIWTYFLHLSFLSFWLTLLRESCPRLDVVHPGRAWSSSPACTWHLSLHHLFLPCFLMVWHKIPVVYKTVILVGSALGRLKTNVFKLLILLQCWITIIIDCWINGEQMLIVRDLWIVFLTKSIDQCLLSS